MGGEGLPRLGIGVVLETVCLVEKQSCTRKINVIGSRKNLNVTGRIEEPVSVVFPEVDVVAKVGRDATTDGADILHVRRVQPVGAGHNVFSHVAEVNHGSAA